MELASPIIEKRGNNRYDVNYGNDAGLLVEFDIRAVRQGFESEKQGREIYKDVEFVSITCPGAPPRRVVRPATEHDKARFHRQYEAFRRQEKIVTEGTPLTELTFLGKAQALNMKAMGIHTAEQLAALPDAGLEAIGLGARELREKTRAFLNKAVDASEITRLVSDNKSLLEQMKVMQSQLAALQDGSKPKETLQLKGKN